jgi:hypothetical protein
MPILAETLEPLAVEQRDQARRLYQMAHNLTQPCLTVAQAVLAAQCATDIADELMLRLGLEMGR